MDQEGARGMDQAGITARFTNMRRYINIRLSFRFFCLYFIKLINHLIMLGYFIPKEKAEQLGILSNPVISSELQRTILVITENDLLEGAEREGKRDIDLSEKRFVEFADWFYRNYYDSLIEILNK